MIGYIPNMPSGVNDGPSGLQSGGIDGAIANATYAGKDTGFTVDFDFNKLAKMLDDYRNYQYSYNAQQVQDQRKWLEMMSNTSYQRAMDDMRRAGINPLVAFQSGLQGAEVPSSSAASGSLTQPGSLFSALVSILTTNTKLVADIFKGIFGLIKQAM